MNDVIIIIACVFAMILVFVIGRILLHRQLIKMVQEAIDDPRKAEYIEKRLKNGPPEY